MSSGGLLLQGSQEIMQCPTPPPSSESSGRLPSAGGWSATNPSKSIRDVLRAMWQWQVRQAELHSRARSSGGQRVNARGSPKSIVRSSEGHTVPKPKPKGQPKVA